VRGHAVAAKTANTVRRWVHANCRLAGSPAQHDADERRAGLRR